VDIFLDEQSILAPLAITSGAHNFDGSKLKESSPSNAQHELSDLPTNTNHFSTQVYIHPKKVDALDVELS